MSSGAIILDVHEIVRRAEQGRAAVQRNDWDRAEQALMEAQDRIARVLRELALKRKSPRFKDPPSSVEGAPD
jgi:hypothetical protein